MKADFFVGANARARAVTFNPRTAIFGFGINASVGQQPIAHSGTGVLRANEVGAFGGSHSIRFFRNASGQRRRRAQSDRLADHFPAGDRRRV